jgi:hypothetical protein
LFLLLALAGYSQMNSAYDGPIEIFGAVLYHRADIWLDVALTCLTFGAARLNTASRQVIRE